MKHITTLTLCLFASLPALAERSVEGRITEAVDNLQGFQGQLVNLASRLIYEKMPETSVIWKSEVPGSNPRTGFIKQDQQHFCKASIEQGSSMYPSRYSCTSDQLVLGSRGEIWIMNGAAEDLLNYIQTRQQAFSDNVLAELFDDELNQALAGYRMKLGVWDNVYAKEVSLSVLNENGKIVAILSDFLTCEPRPQYLSAGGTEFDHAPKPQSHEFGCKIANPEELLFNLDKFRQQLSRAAVKKETP